MPKLSKDFSQIPILLLLHSPILSHSNFTVFASKSVPRFSHLKFHYLRRPLQQKYQSAHAQKNLSITTKTSYSFFTERDVILLVFLFLDTESLQDIPDAEVKLMCLHSTASKIINISTMPMVQNILRMCAVDSDNRALLTGYVRLNNQGVPWCSATMGIVKEECGFT